MDIIELAKEAGAMFDHMTWVERDLAPVFERFATLVRAEALEEAAKVCDTRSEQWITNNDALEARRCAAAIRVLK